MEDFALYMQKNGSGFLAVLVGYIVLNLLLHTLILFWMNKWASSQDYHEGIYVWMYIILTMLACLVAVFFAHYVHTRDYFK